MGLKGKIVVKLSGSLFEPSKEEPARIRKIAKALQRLSDDGYGIVAVAGGGKVARQYIEAGRALGTDESSLDQIGIEVSRLNARLLVSALKGAYQEVPISLEEVARMAESKNIVVTGGLHPGHSTNAVAALIAEKIRADIFINATDVDGVYSVDPRKDKKGKLLKEVNTKKLTEMLMDDAMQAGTYDLMDLVALKIIQRSKVKTRIVKCSGDTIIAAAKGKPLGTLVTI
ncbi:MAG: UMP kinase [Thaumarchaeota archaeon]|nr:UMP kinase [Nitrososphaerota archaeon]